MDFQKVKQVDDGSSSSSSKKVPNKLFDLNLLPEEEENDEFYIEIFGSFETPQAALNLTDNNHEVHANSNSNGLVVSPFPTSGAGTNNGTASIFNNPTTSSAATEMVTPSNHPFDHKRRARHNDGFSASTGTARSLCPRRPEPNYDQRICTNYNCRTRNTPMWRRGPLGPKTYAMPVEFSIRSK